MSELNVSLVVTIAAFVFFTGIAWEHFAVETPSWVRPVTGVASAVLALAALVALF